jgi:hypothetical protein
MTPQTRFLNVQSANKCRRRVARRWVADDKIQYISAEVAKIMGELKSRTQWSENLSHSHQKNRFSVMIIKICSTFHGNNILQCSIINHMKIINIVRLFLFRDFWVLL